MPEHNPYRYPVHTVKPRRLAAGLTQMQLAIALGVDLDTIRDWDQQRRYPNDHNAQKLDDLLGPPPREDHNLGLDHSIE